MIGGCAPCRTGAVTRVLRDLLVLTLLCAAAYLPGIAAMGLTTERESLRLIAAQEMHARSDWLVPSIQGHVYLDKPPLMYWCILLLSGDAGPGEAELRLTAAIAGLLGVLASYWCAATLFRNSPVNERFAVAFWTGALLATGLLYARASRTGAIDILLAAPTALAFLLIFLLWNESRRPARWAYTAALCAVSGVLMLVKGPPGLIAPVLASLLAPIAAEAFPADAERRRRRPAILAGALAGAAVLVFRAGEVTEFTQAVGLAVFCLMAWEAGRFFVRAAPRGSFRPVLAAWARIGVPVWVVAGGAALGAWASAVAARLGPEAVRRAADEQASENIQILDLDAPLRSLEAMSYGAGMGSVFAIVTLVWLGSRRPPIPRAVWLLLAWVLAGFIAFSSLGGGSGRYLLPLCPGVAMLGAWGFVELQSRRPSGARARVRALMSFCAAASVGLGVWYGVLRPMLMPDRSSRAFVQELRREQSLDQFAGMFSFEFWSASLAVYAGRPVEPVMDQKRVPDYQGEPVTPEEMVRRMRHADGAGWVILLREHTPRRDDGLRDAEEVLAGLGVKLRRLPVDAEYRIDEYTTPVNAYHAWIPDDPAADGDGAGS